MNEALERFDLCALPPPFPVAPMPHRFVRSARHAGDPASRWLRTVVLKCFKEALARSEANRKRALAARPQRAKKQRG